MSVNYNSKKKPELEALLKERGLAHTGNKPDLVARLQEDDASKAGVEGGVAATATADEDKIDWDDEDTNAASSNLAAAQATDNPAHKVALEAGGIGRVNNPVDVPNQVVDEANEPGKTDDTVVSPPAEAGTVADAAAPTEEQTKEDAEAKKKAYEEKFGANLAASEADAEAEKRKQRAQRFMIAAPSADDEAAKLEERAKKFGTSTDKDDRLAKMLDSALPERAERRGDRKRGRDRADIGRGGIQKRVDGRRRDNRPRGGPGRSGPSENDRIAMERRAARFSRSN